MAFPCLTIFMIFIIWLSFRLSKVKHNMADKEEAFWNKELKANSTPKKDIDNLNYITIPLEKFPSDFTTDSEVLDIVDKLNTLSSERILNITGITNTDIKLSYGVGNFDKVSKYGDNFDTLTVLINQYAKKALEHNREDIALPVLEFAIGIKTDISESYTLLANLYKQNEKKEKLEYLIEQVNTSNLLLKQSILNQINTNL